MSADGPTTVRDRDVLERAPGAALAIDCLLAGIDAARPGAVVESGVALEGSTLVVDDETYDLDAFERVLVLGGGNAAGQVAAALESLLGDRIDGGLVVTDDPVPLDRVESVVGAHPYPDRAALEGAERVAAVADDAGPDDLLLGVVTGGGSALLPAPAGDVSLDDLRDLTEALVRSGATIAEINCVRKHVSALKGGRLAARAAPATVAALVVSDVVGDDPATVASGPFSPDPTTYEDARSALDRYDLPVPDSVRRRLDRGAGTGEAGRSAAPATGAPDVEPVAETPDATDPAFASVDVHVLASNDTAIEAAREVAADAGYEPLVLSTRIEGEARTVGTVLAGVAEEVRASGRPVEPPAVVLSGGEATVTVGDSSGRGGPNQEVALAAALALSSPDVVVASADTDGIDGTTDAAGALVTTDTVGDPAAARAALDEHDAYPVLDAADALLRTGPTGTNVNDLRVVVVPER